MLDKFDSVGTADLTNLGLSVSPVWYLMPLQDCAFNNWSAHKTGDQMKSHGFTTNIARKCLPADNLNPEYS